MDSTRHRHPPYEDRRHAGRALAQLLAPKYAHRCDVTVLALPRGGVPVAFEVAHLLAAPLDVFVVRKLGLPGHAELAIGAIASGDVRILNRDVIAWHGVDDEVIDRVTDAEKQELERRERTYRDERAAASIGGRTVILVDDGLATGATMRAAVQAVGLRAPARVIVAVPVAAAETCEEIEKIADEVVCGMTPRDFGAVGQWYRNFSQTTDEEVRTLLRRVPSSEPS